MSDVPFFHEASGSIRFWVEVDGQWIGASIGKETLSYHYRPENREESPLDTYTRHAPAIETAVRHRVAEGAREPVMLRDHDLRTR